MRVDSQKYRFLELVAISGEFPVPLANRIPGRARFRRKYIDELKQEEWLSVYSRDGMRGYRLTPRARNLLMENNSNRFSFFLQGKVDTNMIRVNPARRARLYRLAEATVLMHNAGVHLFRDEKPYLFNPVAGIHDAAIEKPVYYSAREVKELGLEYLKIKNSRSTGVMLTPEEAYLVYSLGSGLINWFRNAEERSKYILAETLMGYGIYSSLVVPKALVIGDSMDRMVRIVKESRVLRSPFNIFTDTFSSMCFIPNTEDGDVLLKVLCSVRLRRGLNTALLSGFPRTSTGEEVLDFDASDEAGTPTLFAYDCDMVRISRFLTVLQLNGWSGSMICFDFQYAALSELYGEIVEIRAIDFAALRKEFQI